uniref:Uncharacterized protein n=1 Tax=Plectus sambesii TaxID=2011161 RepID=A0A914W758_9BILA
MNASSMTGGQAHLNISRVPYGRMMTHGEMNGVKSLRAPATTANLRLFLPVQDYRVSRVEPMLQTVTQRSPALQVHLRLKSQINQAQIRLGLNQDRVGAWRDLCHQSMRTAVHPTTKKYLQADPFPPRRKMGCMKAVQFPDHHGLSRPLEAVRGQILSYPTMDAK